MEEETVETSRMNPHPLVRRAAFALLFFLSTAVTLAAAEDGRISWQAEWERTLAAAKKEGKVVAGIPASADLRREIETAFKRRFGLETELMPARGPQNASRIAAEHRAGARYFDALIGGTGTALPLAQAKMLAPLESTMIVPEVKDPKSWWGGHIWDDNKSTNRFIYSFQAYMNDDLWYNSNLVGAQEIKSYDDLLNPKWKGKIGFLDPRNPGSGYAIWTFLYRMKGPDFLRRFARQELLMDSNQRQLADAIAKGRIALSFGITSYTFQPFINAGIPLRSFPPLDEGGYVTMGSGGLSVVGNAPHPNATKVFVNWLLGKEGQEIFGRTMTQATRRVDVDTRWLQPHGVRAAKDFLPDLEAFHRRRSHLEDRVTSEERSLASKLAEEVLK
jgi:ABC-type Fe3+ transport system substrate-binding protein